VSVLVPLTENRDFRRLYGRGKSFVAPVLVTYCAKNRAGITRVGITTGKKIGIAVQRSRARRVIREAYRSMMDGVKPGYDLVFVARGRTCRVKMQEVAAAMRAQLKKAGVLE
jgi:ribonuclease P protein component